MCMCACMYVCASETKRGGNLCNLQRYPAPNHDCTGKCLVALDCAGVCGGSTQEDACGVCGGRAKSADKCRGSSGASTNQATPPPPPPPPVRKGSKAPPPPPPPPHRSKAAKIIDDVKKAAQRRGSAATPPPPPPPRGDRGANGNTATSNDVFLDGGADNGNSEPAEDDVPLTDSPHVVKGIAIGDWGNEAVTTWLKRIGLPSEAISQFAEWDVDGSMLLELDDVRCLFGSVHFFVWTAVHRVLCSAEVLPIVCFCDNNDNNRPTSKTWE